MRKRKRYWVRRKKRKRSKNYLIFYLIYLIFFPSFFVSCSASFSFLSCSSSHLHTWTKLLLCTSRESSRKQTYKIMLFLFHTFKSGVYIVPQNEHLFHHVKFTFHRFLRVKCNTNRLYLGGEFFKKQCSTKWEMSRLKDRILYPIRKKFNRRNTSEEYKPLS